MSNMVSKWVENLANKSSGSNQDFMAKMRAIMDDLCRQNQTLENNFLHIQKRQQESDLPEETKVLKP